MEIIFVGSKWIKKLFVPESEWVPVTPKEKKEEDKVFTKPEAPVREPESTSVVLQADGYVLRYLYFFV